MFAWAVFKEQCKACGCKDATEVKEKAPQWRKKVKAVEFAYMFGAAAPTISKAAECTVEEAHNALNRLLKKNLIEMRTVPTEICKGHKRNFAYYVNVSYLHSILMLYSTDIWI